MKISAQKLLSKSRKFLKKNSSTILTCIGGIGFVGTVMLSVKETPKALALIEEAEQQDPEITTMGKVIAAAPAYIPSLILGGTTLFCIFGANALSRKQQASLASAYAFVDQSYKDYRRKLKELYGDEADVAIRDAIIKDKYDAEPPYINVSGIISSECIEVMADHEEVHLFYDEISERYFESTLVAVQAAEYHLNRNFCLGIECPLNDFYTFLGIPKVDWGDSAGWIITGDYYWIDFDHRKVQLEDGLECITIAPVFAPDPDYLEY